MKLFELHMRARNFVLHARGKLTTYVGLLIMSAGELRGEWPTIVSQLPTWPWLVMVEHHVFLILGVMVIVARVRRLLGTPP